MSSSSRSSIEVREEAAPELPQLTKESKIRFLDFDADHFGPEFYGLGKSIYFEDGLFISIFLWFFVVLSIVFL